MIRQREVPRTDAEERRRAQRPFPRQQYNDSDRSLSSSSSSFAPLITLAEVSALLQAYGVSLPPRNLELYRRALTHVSASPGGNELLSNERLEYAGDGVLESVFKTHVVRRFPHLREDRLSYLKVALVSNLTIGTAARKMGLARWYQVAADKVASVMNDDKAMGDIFEAFVGAIYADYDDARIALRDVGIDSSLRAEVASSPQQAMGAWCVYWPEASSEAAKTPPYRMGRGPGYIVAQDFVERVYELHVDWTTLLATETNFKGVLQERLQRELKLAPVYVPHHLSSNTLSMTVWWNWGAQPPPSSRQVVVSLLEDVRSLDDVRAMQASEPYVHMLLLELPPMQGTIKEVEQFAAEKIWKTLPPSHPPTHRNRGDGAPLKVRRPVRTDDIVRAATTTTRPTPDVVSAAAFETAAETAAPEATSKKRKSRSPSPSPAAADKAPMVSALQFRATSFRSRVGKSTGKPPTVARYMGPATVGNGYDDEGSAKRAKEKGRR